MNASEDIRNLEEEYRRLIDIREGIGRQIADCRACFGQNTRRREDQVDRLQEEYNRVQRRILEVDKQIRSAHPLQAHTTF